MAVLLSIEPQILKIQPGSTVTAQICIRNQGSVVDEFRLTVLGDAAPWATLEPSSVNLFPRTEGSVSLTFSLPRASTPVAGDHAFGVLAKSIADPDASTSEEGTITVEPFVALRNDVHPQTSRARRVGKHVVRVRNDGNAAASVSATAQDTDGELLLTLAPQAATVEPGGQAELGVQAGAKGWLILGPPKRVAFSVDVVEATTGSHQAAATFEQRPLLPGWLLGAAGIVVALAVVLFTSGILNPPAGSATPTPAGAISTAGGGVPTAAGATPQVPGPTPDGPTPAPTDPTGPFGFGDFRISGPGFDGEYPTSTAQAYIENGVLIFYFPVTVNNADCNVQAHMPAFSGPGGYDMGDPATSPVFGFFSCDGGTTFRSVSGTLAVEQSDPPFSGRIVFGGTDDAGIDTVSVSGAFRDVPLVD